MFELRSKGLPAKLIEDFLILVFYVNAYRQTHTHTLTRAELGQEGQLSSISIIAFLDTPKDSTHTLIHNFLLLETWLTH